MKAAILELEKRGRLSRDELSEFLDSHTFPLVEGSTVTFLYRGMADQVLLRHWVQGLPSPQPFRGIPGSDVWYLVLELPEHARLEYKIELHRGPERVLIQDPLNPNVARDPFGANSVLYGAGYQVPDWVLEDSEARRGKLESIAIQSRVFGEERAVSVYLPARFRRRRRYPLLIVHDGEDYLRYSSLATVLDNLIHRLEIPSLVAALIQSPRRTEEYAADPAHDEFLVGELLPELSRRYPLAEAPSARALMGASFGAVASLAAAWRNPGLFGKLLLQSGSFVFTDVGAHEHGPHFDHVVEFVNAFRKDPGRPARQAYLSCGIFEGLIYYNRSMLPILQSTRMRVRYREAADGHNWENWRDRLREGLSWLFPGPLWMVYE